MPKSPFKKSVLSNGVRVLTESYPQSRAVVVGIWILTGTRDEQPDLNGISHLLEHMVFKGTKNRSVKDIAMSLEAVGGELNAYTTKEYTCYHTVSLKEHLTLCVDVLSDLVTSATFPEKEFDREKKVILQEIAMSQEDHSEWIFDEFLLKALGRHPAGKPILGNEKTVQAMERKQVASYYREHHQGKNILVTASGALNHDELIELLQKRLSRLQPGSPPRRRRPSKVAEVRQVIERPSEQVHVLLGMPTVSYKSPYHYESFFVNTLLGGGMTSRLYQSVRENKGLAYAVYSYLYTFIDFAWHFYYAGTDQKNYRKTAEIILKELKRLKEKGLKRKDLELYKMQIKGGLLLSADDLDARMTSLAHNEMIFRRHRPIEEMAEQIEKISIDSVHAYLEEEFHFDSLGVSVLGQFKDSPRDWLNSIDG